MKKMLLLLVVIVYSGMIMAQGVGEWLNQKSTQKKYLLQQIAALKTHAEYLKRGYRIVDGGLKTVSGFTNGEFNLHGDYFNALKTVNPNIRKYAKVSAALSLQASIVRQCSQLRSFSKDGAGFPPREADYVGGVIDRLLEDCEAELTLLAAVLMDGQLEMKDDERLLRIDGIYSNLQQQYRFIKGFSNQTRVLSVARAKEKSNINNSRMLHGIKNQ